MYGKPLPNIFADLTLYLLLSLGNTGAASTVAGPPGIIKSL